MHTRAILTLTTLLASALTFADVTPLDNNELEAETVTGPVVSENAQTIEELEALQDQQRMLPNGERRVEPGLSPPPPAEPAAQQQYLNNIRNTLDNMPRPTPTP